MTSPTLGVVQGVFPDLLSIDELKSGGQKSVFLAECPEHGRIVVKVLLHGGSDARVEREIDIVSRNSFHNVPRIISHARHVFGEEEWLFIKEDYIEGKDLRMILTDNESLPFSEVVNLMDDLLMIACEMEAAGIVHRDIKPDNIQCSTSGGYWLLDFGIARDLHQSSLTATAAHFGPHTAGYAAPEQFRNMKKKIDARTDMFSIGVVAYEALTGKHPFSDGATSYLDILNRTESLRVDTLDIPEDANGKMCQYIAVLMEKYPSRRPPTACIAKEWFDNIVQDSNGGGA